MNAPIIKLLVKSSQRDLSDKVESLRYESCVEKDNLVTIEIKTGYAFEMADDADIIAGTIIQFQFGKAGGQLSRTHLARITDVDTEYGARVKLTVKALDLGTTMKKDGVQKVWKDKKASEIAKEIASKYGLSTKIDETSTKLKSVPQANMTDFEFLQYLAGREANGSYMFYIDNDVLCFVKRDLKQKSKITYKYGENIVKFLPKMKEAQQSGASTGAEVKNVNPFDLSTLTGKADSKTVKDNVTMGAQGVETVMRDANGNIINTVKNISAPVRDKNEATNIASSKNKKANAKALTATLDVDGNPLLMANDIISIEGVARRHEGNWYVTKAVHKVDKTYTVSMELDKNGTNKSVKSGAGTNSDVNKTQGDKNPKQTVELVKRDPNGVKI